MKHPEYIDTIKQGDCIALMSEMPDECVDLIITDPPFAIDFKATRHNYNRKGDRVLQGYNEIAGSDYLAFTLDWLSAATRGPKGFWQYVYLFGLELSKRPSHSNRSVPAHDSQSPDLEIPVWCCYQA